MADKILNTRILMKVDTLENWSTSTLPLKKGELAFATIAATAGNGLTEPVVMVKIGEDGVKTFKDLEWNFYAKASDVLAACKSEDALNTYIKNRLNAEGVATTGGLSELAGKVTTAEDEIDTLQSEMDAVEAKAAANEAAIGELDTLVGDKAVATQISEAIAALDLANTYEAKGEAAKVQTALDTYKNSNDAKVLEHTNSITANTNAITAIKDGETLDSFKDVETALAGKEAAGEAAKAEAAAKAYADGLAGNYDAKGAAATAESNAKTYAKEYADGLAGNYDAAGSAAAAETAAKKHADDELTRLVGDKTVGTQITEAITGLDLGNTYAAKAHTHVKADITDFAHTHEISEVTGLQDALDGKQAVGDYATKAEAQGYANAKDEAIAAAQAAADQAQEEVDALETYVGTIPEGYTETNVVAYINKKAEETLAAASGNSTETAASVKAALDTYKSENNAAVKANADAIAELEELVGDEKVSDAIAAAVEVEKTRAEGVEGGLETRLKAVEDDYLKAADKTELEGKITTNANAIERLTNGVSAEEVDGVNDLIQYVKDHGTEVTGMKEDISDNADAIAAEKERAEGIEGGLDSRLQAVEAAVGETGSVATAIEGAVTEAKGYTDAEVKKLAEGAVATNAADIAALETKVGDETVSEQITAVTDPLAERVVALEAIDHEHANKDLLDTYTQTEANLADAVAKKHEHANKAELDKIVEGDKAAWDAKVDDVTAAAGSGLKATRSGNTVAIEIDESVTFIFDCGSSAE